MQVRAFARRLGSALVVGAMPVLATAAHAQGFGLNEIGSCSIARAGATTGAPCEDASVIYWNPAAAARLPRGTQAYVGASAIQVKGSFTQDYTGRRSPGDVPIEFPPFVGVTWKGSGRLAAGIAAYVPYGLTSQWEDDFVGRFSAQRASLQTIYVQPNVAYEVIPGRLSLGGGVVFGHSQLELRQALDAAGLPLNAQQLAFFGLPAGSTFASAGIAPGTEFGRLRVKGSGNGFGFNVGAHANLTRTLTVGARYLSQVRFDYEGGDAEFSVSPFAASYAFGAGTAGAPFGLPTGGTLAQVVGPQFAAGGAFGPGQTASTRIDHPAQFQVGLGWTGLPGTTLSADYARIAWASFDALPVNITTAAGTASPLSRVLREDYEASHAVRVSAEHRYRSGLAARLGFGYATSPAPDVTVTPLLPDMDRYNLAAGVAIPLGPVVLDASYLRVETQGRRGRTGERLDESLAAEQINNGWYALNANVLSLSLKARF